jgi:hypothetical protein
MQNDCAAVCECYGTCGDGETCVCDACARFSDDAAADSEFVSIASSASSSGASAAVIAELSAGGVRRRARRLLQANGTADMQQNLTTVGGPGWARGLPGL